MDHIHSIDGFETFYYLTQEIPGFLLGKSSSQLAEFFQVTAVAVLHEQIEVVGRLLDVTKADHIGVLDLAQNPYFAFQILSQSGI